MSSRNTQISVTIPALNEEKTILNLLKCFRKQTFKDFEVIVVDNGSRDKTKAIVQKEIKQKKFILKLLNEPKKGVGYARKKGMDDAAKRNIPYLAGTDADTIVPSNWLEKILSSFERTQADLLLGYLGYD